MVQGSRKTGCHAHISIKKCIAYPEYQNKLKSTRTVHENILVNLKRALSNGNAVATRTLYFVSLPLEDAHNGHLTESGPAGLVKRMHEKVAAKITELVGESITDIYT